MYFPIPNGVNVKDTQTASVPPTECDVDTWTDTQTASYVIAASTVALEKRVDSNVYERIAPVDGSWQKVRESKEIKMTAMRVISEQHRYFVAGLQRPYFAYRIAKIGKASARVNGRCLNCQRVLVSAKLAKVQGRYIEQGDIDYWKSKYPNVPHFRDIETLDSDKIELAKGEAYSELFQAYNLGEELYEFRETIASIGKLTLEAVALIRNARALITSLLEKGLKKEAANRWMEFRYGIMPIIFSIQDILALKSENGLYRTVRKKVKPDVPDSTDGRWVNPIYFVDSGVSELKCHVTAKGRWATEELKMLDIININPLTTAFEVYPWAMVIRWFVNVSSYINSRVKSLTSLALEYKACLSIREKMEYGTYLHAEQGYIHHPLWNGDSGACGAGYYGVHDFGVFQDKVVSDILLSWHSINNYNRYLFQPSDVKLVLSPHITWQRTVDSLILGSGRLSKLLRRLK
mgnify:CR=1 FL=1